VGSLGGGRRKPRPGLGLGPGLRVVLCSIHALACKVIGMSRSCPFSLYWTYLLNKPYCSHVKPGKVQRCIESPCQRVTLSLVWRDAASYCCELSNLVISFMLLIPLHKPLLTNKSLGVMLNFCYLDGGRSHFCPDSGPRVVHQGTNHL
jgi:hypothetical protein